MNLFGVKMNKDMLLFTAAVVVIVLSVFLFFNKVGFLKIWDYFHKSNSSVSEIILFYGNNCDHCAKVDNFIANNNIEAKVVFTRLEVFNNSANADILADKARICGLDPSQIGVPFLWDGAHCIIGDVDVIAFFQQKIAKSP